MSTDVERVGMGARTPWTAPAVLDRIRERAVAGLSLGAKAVRKADRALLRAADRLYGGWPDALEAATTRYPQIASIALAAEQHRPMTAPPSEEGARLRHARIAAGLSQSAAAARAGVTQATWSTYETGERGMQPPPKAWSVLATDWSGPRRGKGGSRPGAGRPQRSPTAIPLSVRVSPEARAIIDEVPVDERGDLVSRLIIEWRSRP